MSRRRVLGLLVLLAGCSPVGPDSTEWVYRIPDEIGDGWRTSSLAQAGLDEARLTLLMRILGQNPNHRVHGIVIAVDGALAFEEYFPGKTHPTFGEVPVQFSRERKHGLSSVTKSVTATLLGIAIDRGFISSLDERVFDFFPEYADLRVGRKGDITLKHLVTMSAGLQWDEQTYPIGDAHNDITQWIRFQGDRLRFVLERPLVAEPGVEFTYNGGLTNVLGEVIRRASGMRLDQFAEAYLFGPLGITDYAWYELDPDFVYASGDLSLRPRDAAKLGQLYLQDGEWGGERVLSPAWVESSKMPAVPTGQSEGYTSYSYGWWTTSGPLGREAFAALGWGEQAIIVTPEFHMIAVFTGGSYWEDPLITPYGMMVEFVIPSR
jgi:CubicO group peptidase (beta-lactamase class C family)